MYFTCKTKHVVALATKYCLNEMRFLLCVCVLRNCTHHVIFSVFVVLLLQCHNATYRPGIWTTALSFTWRNKFLDGCRVCFNEKKKYPQRQRLSTQQGPSVSAVFAWHNRKLWRLPVPTCQKCGVYHKTLGQGKNTKEVLPEWSVDLRLRRDGMCVAPTQLHCSLKQMDPSALVTFLKQRQS